LRTNGVWLIVGLAALVGSLSWGAFYAYSRYDESRTLILATTTSTEDSGLLDALLPPFEAANKCRVDVVAVGSGQALELGRNGDADALLVHSPAAEETFMDEGHGLSRTQVMYNDFIIVGPPTDPIGVKSAADLATAMRTVATAGVEERAIFLSRGDDSGTDKKEKGLWTKFAIQTKGAWYQETGSGMGDTLIMAADRGAYTLADRATYLSGYGPGATGEGKLAVLWEGGRDLYNPYAVIVTDPVSHPNVNQRLAEAFAAYLGSTEGRTIISTFGADKYGQPLFWLLPEGSRP